MKNEESTPTNKNLKSPFSPDTTGKVRFPSLAVVPMQKYCGGDEDESDTGDKDDPTEKGAKAS